jgi:hypothetical protein
MPKESQDALEHLKRCPQCCERVKVLILLEKLYSNDEMRPSRLKIYLLAAGLMICTLLPATMMIGPERGRESRFQVELVETRAYPLFIIDPRDDVSGERKRAWEAYLHKDYQSALSELSQLEDDPEVVFYRGVCEYMLGMNETANIHLSHASSLEKRWEQPALWYRANILLRFGKMDPAIRLLKQLKRTGGEYSAEAETLMKRLEKWGQP